MPKKNLIEKDIHSVDSSFLNFFSVYLLLFVRVIYYDRIFGPLNAQPFLT